MSVPSVPIETQSVPQDQEQQFVHEVYNEIASHFSLTRYKPWPIVEKFLLGRPDYSLGIDVGCGNGKYLGVNKKLVIIGSDRSDGLVTCAQENSKNGHLLCVADGLHLPHQNDRFDFAISIAVIHHFATEERRIDAIRHILLKVKKGGHFLVYCWALEQEKSRRGYKEGDDQDILVPWVLQKKQPKKEKTRKDKRKQKPASDYGTGHAECEKDQTTMEGSASDSKLETPESQSAPVEETPATETKYRYYHLYKEGELNANAELAGGKVVEHGYEKDNWWAIIEKL